MTDPFSPLEQNQLGCIAFQCSDSEMAVVSKDQTVLAANSAFHQLLGYADQQLLGVHLSSLLHPRIHTMSKEGWEELQEIHFLHAEGHHVEAQVVCKSLPSGDASLLQIKKSKLYQSVQHPSEESAVSLPSLEELLDGIPDGFLCLDSFGRFTYMNKAAEHILRRSREELLGTSFWHSFPEAIGTPLYEHYLSCTTNQAPETLQVYYAPKKRWFEIHAYPKDNMYSAFFRDITRAKHTEKTLQESENMYRMLAENSTDMIARISPDGVFLYISPASMTLLGYTPKELVGRRIHEFFHPEDFTVHLYQENMQLNDLNLNLSAYRFRKKDGSYLWFESTARHIYNEQGQQSEMVCICRDISTRKHAERQLIETNQLLQKMSTVDALTGIANRRGFDECFKREWKQAIRDGSPLSMILVDIDYFKRYNDSYGHAVGDLCLKQVASVLSQAAERPGDFIARYGGEEFVLLLPSTDTRGAFTVAEKLRKAVESLRIAHIRSDTSLVTISLGTATMVPTLESDAKELFFRADKALYQAKQDGRNLSRMYRYEA